MYSNLNGNVGGGSQTRPRECICMIFTVSSLYLLKVLCYAPTPFHTLCAYRLPHSCIPAILRANVLRTSTRYHPISPTTRPVTFSRNVWKYVAVLRRENHQSPSTAKFILNQHMQIRLDTFVAVDEWKFGTEKCGNNSHHKNKDA